MLIIYLKIGLKYLWGKLETVSVLKNFQNYTVLNLFSVFETEKYHNTKWVTTRSFCEV